MQLFLYLFCVSGIHVKSFYGSRKTETIAKIIKIPNINISSDEDLSDDNSPRIIYESTEWEETSASSSSESEIAPSTHFITKQPVTKKKRGIKFLFSAEYLVSVTILRSPLANLTTYVHQMNQIWVQVVMFLFDLQGLYLTSAITNFTLITGSIVFRCKFSCMNVVFFYWGPFVVTDSGNVSCPLKKK